MKKEVNQQGTLEKDTSETIRIKNFNDNIKKSFLNWFIGYVEGCENVFIVNRRYLRFELNVNIKNESIIYYIKNTLDFGNIRKLRFLDTQIVEYSVQENVFDLLKLIYIFNGNFRCNSKEHNFRIWYKKLYVKLKKLNLLNLLPDYNKDMKLISLSNSWLLGYMDSRVLFYGRWHKSKKLKEGKELYLNCIFWHLNQDLLLKIKEVLNSTCKIEYKTKWNLPFYKLVIDNIEEKKIVMNYLNKYKLKSIKKKRYKYWKLLLLLEEKYLIKGEQNINEIENILIKLMATLDNEELSKV